MPFSGLPSQARTGRPLRSCNSRSGRTASKCSNVAIRSVTGPAVGGAEIVLHDFVTPADSRRVGYAEVSNTSRQRSSTFVRIILAQAGIFDSCQTTPEAPTMRRLNRVPPFVALVSLVLLVTSFTARATAQERLRLLIETDAGGDPDDEQSL